MRAPLGSGRLARTDHAATKTDDTTVVTDVKDMVRELRAELRTERQRLSHLLKRSQA